MEVFGRQFAATGIWTARLRGPVLALIAAVACSDAALADGPCTDSGAFDKIEPIQSCEGKPENCNQCKQAIEKQKKKGKKFDQSVAECKAGAGACPIQSDAVPDSAASAELGHYPWLSWLSRLSCESAYAMQQKSSAENGNKSSSAAATCERNAAAKTRDAAKIAEDCTKAIQAACGGIDEGQKAADICKEAAAKANKTASDDDAKAQQAQSNADKNADNAKKDGGMPQIPQIPQMPKSQDSQSSDPSLSSATDASITSATSTAPQIETTRLDGSSPTGASSVGFGGSSTTNTATSTSPGYPSYGSSASMPASTESPIAGSPLGSTGGSTSGMGGVGGGGSSGSGGGALNSTGASSPGEKGPAAGDSASPYEVSGGGGGKLGAPKGFKGGGEGDSAIADAAKDTFKADLGLDANRNPASDGRASLEDEADSGFTVFKMIKARYVELKKQGSI